MPGAIGRHCSRLGSQYGPLHQLRLRLISEREAFYRSSCAFWLTRLHHSEFSFAKATHPEIRIGELNMECDRMFGIQAMRKSPIHSRRRRHREDQLTLATRKGVCGRKGVTSGSNCLGSNRCQVAEHLSLDLRELSPRFVEASDVKAKSTSTHFAHLEALQPAMLDRDDFCLGR